MRAGGSDGIAASDLRESVIGTALDGQTFFNVHHCEVKYLEFTQALDEPQSARNEKEVLVITLEILQYSQERTVIQAVNSEMNGRRRKQKKIEY